MRLLRFTVPFLILAAAVVVVPAIAGTDRTRSQAPAPPRRVTATVRAGTVTLRWRASTSARVKGYAVWRRGNPRSSWAQIGRTQALRYTDTAATAGHRYAYAVRAYRSADNLSAPSAIVTAKVAVVRGDMGATGYRSLVEPKFRPTFTVTARTPARFAADLARLRAGEKLDVKPMTIPGAYLINKNFRSYAEIHFAPGVVFSGATNFRYYTVEISNSSNIRIYGGQVMNPTNGPCVRITDSTNIIWWHFYVHNCAATGMQVGSSVRDSTGIDLDGTIDHVGYDVSFDPHPEKCTGIHGMYLGGDLTYSVSGKISIHVHDSVCGAGIQDGCHTSNMELWLKVEDLVYSAQHPTPGNAIQFWCANLSHITVHDVVANNIAGQVVSTGGVYPGGMSSVVVQYGRGTKTLQHPRLARINYGTGVRGIAYLDVAPSP